MYKSFNADIEKFKLDTNLYKLHKSGFEHSNFGMNNTSELLNSGFGLYSTSNTIKKIGPVKTEYYRIGLVRSGSANFTIGLESFKPVRNTIIFGFPGQLFSYFDPSDDFFTYYMLFNEEFIGDVMVLNNYRSQLPFLNYSGIQCFPVSEEDGNEIENIFHKINTEVKTKKTNATQAIWLYIQLILLSANRNYNDQFLSSQALLDPAVQIYTRYIKLVSQHFLTLQKVNDYAKLMYISSDHLNRVIKSVSDKTALQLIDEMILREAKAYLLYSEMSISEIAFKLEFSDPSHFNKFFKRLTSKTPSQFRIKSD